jgi:hypothetical protein
VLAAVILGIGFLIAIPTLCQIPHAWLLMLFDWTNLQPRLSCEHDVSPGADLRHDAVFLIVYIVISRV